MPRSIDVVIAERRALARSALRSLVQSAADLRVVGSAGHGQEAIEVVGRLQPEVLLLDLMLSGMGGLDVIDHLVQSGSPTRVVVLASHTNDAYAVEALRNGALGFVGMDAEPGDLHHAIRLAAQGRRFTQGELSERARRAIEAGDGSADPLHRLSSRERQAFHLAVEGLSNAEVAERLFISPRTAEKHRARFLKKLGLRSQGDLVRFAVIHRLLPGLDAPDHSGAPDAR